MIDFLFGLLGEVFTGGSGGLNTRKIDNNIERLKQHDWFKRIYEDEKYRRMFFTNRHVRAYLQSNLRVKKMMRTEKAQLKLLHLLEKQFKAKSQIK